MRAQTTLWVVAILALFGMTMNAAADESRIRVGAIDAVLTIPPAVDRPPVALLIAGSGTTDHDGNGPQVKPATLKKLSQQLVARKIATLRYDKRGSGGWKPEFGRPEDFRFKDYVDDAVALVNYLRETLIIGGGRDLQVARVDFAALSAASPVAKAVWLPDMNHVLVDVTDDADDLAAYNQPERALDPTLIETVAAFVLASDAAK
jgi:hypothetical protein